MAGVAGRDGVGACALTDAEGFVAGSGFGSGTAAGGGGLGESGVGVGVHAATPTNASNAALLRRSTIELREATGGATEAQKGQRSSFERK